MSAPVPGPNGQIVRISRVGKSCAGAAAGINAVQATDSSKPSGRASFIQTSSQILSTVSPPLFCGSGRYFPLRQAVAEGGQDFLRDRLHVRAHHVVRHGAELGLGERGVEACEVLIL